MKELKKELLSVLEKTGCECDYAKYLQYFVITKNTNIDDFREYLEYNNALIVEIVYYSTAIEYLKENDPSLSNSLELAAEYGYTTENLNSEILASLLASQKEKELFEGVDENGFNELITEYFKRRLS